MLYAILIGLDTVDPQYYPIDNPIVKSALVPLNGSAGATALSAAFVEFYGATTFITPPRSAAVIAQFQQLVGMVKPGDVLVCGYAGHGIFMYTTTPDSKRFADYGLGSLAKGDRCWTNALVLEDRMMLADEYNRLLAAFGPGITVVNIIEACASAEMESSILPRPLPLVEKTAASNVVATISTHSDPLSTLLYGLDKAFYDQVLANGPGTLQVDAIQFASVPADQQSEAGLLGSPFSQAIADAIRYSNITSYHDLNTVVTASSNGEFNPVMYAFGSAEQSLLKSKVFAPNARLKSPEKAP